VALGGSGRASAPEGGFRRCSGGVSWRRRPAGALLDGLLSALERKTGWLLASRRDWRGLSHAVAAGAQSLGR
jgi:hypothetical protein